MILSIVMVCIAGVANAIMDVLFFRFSNSIFKNLNPDYWNPKESWRRKWKDGEPKKGERFWLSSTVLVFLTDAWHLFQFLHISFFCFAIIFAFQSTINLIWWQLILLYIGVRIIYSGTFSLFYSIFFISKA